MTYYQYMRVYHNLIPCEVIDEYSSHIEPNNYMYFEIFCDMYGLKESVIIPFR